MKEAGGKASMVNEYKGRTESFGFEMHVLCTRMRMSSKFSHNKVNSFLHLNRLLRITRRWSYTIRRLKQVLHGLG